MNRAADLLRWLGCFHDAPSLLTLSPSTPPSCFCTPAGLIVVGALIGSARALVVEWSSGFTLFY